MDSVLSKVKRETERRLEELRDHYERGGAETERKLKRELKKTKALLKDAQAVIESQVCPLHPLNLILIRANPHCYAATVPFKLIFKK